MEMNTKKIVLAAAGIVAALSLAACSSNNNSTKNSSTTTSSSKSVADKVKEVAGVGTVTNTPTTLADFTATVKAAGYTIIPGTDNEGNQISGAAKESDGSFFVNVKVDNHKGTIKYTTDYYLISFDDLGISDSTSAIYGSNGNAMNSDWIKNHESN
jgi:hypothetical protein